MGKKIDIPKALLRISFIIANMLFIGLIPSLVVFVVGEYSCPYVLSQVLVDAGVKDPVSVDFYGVKMNAAFFFYRTIGMCVFGAISGGLVIYLRKKIIWFLEEL